MNQVKRYDRDGVNNPRYLGDGKFYNGMKEAADGYWVEYKDYEALKADYIRIFDLLEKANAPVEVVDAVFDCSTDNEHFDFDANFSEVSVLNGDNIYSPTLGLYDYRGEFFEEYDQYPAPLKIVNLCINGEMWNFTVNATSTYPAQDYSSYGNWYVDEITLTDKVKQ